MSSGRRRARASRCCSRSTPAPVFADRKTWRVRAAPSPSRAARRSRQSREIGLVVHDDARQRRRQSREDRRVGIGDVAARRGIDEQEREIGARDRRPRALDAERLDRIVGRRAGPRCRRPSAECRRSRSASCTASRVVPAIGVTIAASSPASRLSRLDLPTLGRPTSTTVSPSRSSAPCFARASTCASRARDRRELAAHVGRAQELDVLLGKVERRLGEHPQLDQRVDQRADLARELAGQAARGGARRGRRRRVDQVGDALGLREVELAVEERALA